LGPHDRLAGEPDAIVYHSSAKQIRQIYDSAFGNFRYPKLGLCFHCRETLLIRRIDFFFQNFPNRSKKNNQLDTDVRRKYFANNSLRLLGWQSTGQMPIVVNQCQGVCPGNVLLDFCARLEAKVAE
jgi:hypothetical protein